MITIFLSALKVSIALLCRGICFLTCKVKSIKNIILSFVCVCAYACACVFSKTVCMKAVCLNVLGKENLIFFVIYNMYILLGTVSI